jgi:ATP-binding cassette subfamily B protein
LLILISSIVEIFLLASIFPTISYLAEFETPITSKINFILENSLGVNPPEGNKLFFYLTVFAVFTMLASLLRVTTLWISSKLSFNSAERLRKRLTQKLLGSSFALLSRANSNDIFLLLTEKISVIGPVLNEIFTLINSVIIAITIFMILTLFSPLIAACMILFGVIYVVIILITRRKLQANSQHQNNGIKGVGRSVREAFLGIINIKINQIEHRVTDRINNYSQSELTAMRSSWVIARIPRFLMEGLSILIIAILLIIFIRLGHPAAEIVPLFAVVALGSQRTLPLMQQAFHAYSFISANIYQIGEVLKFLSFVETSSKSHRGEQQIDKFNLIELEEISFWHDENKEPVLDCVSLKIEYGKSYALTGPSGAGKSSLINIICCLVNYNSGHLKINEIDSDLIDLDQWFKKIAYVQQDVQLISGTIYDNIRYLYGDDLDDKYLLKCLSVACLWDCKNKPEISLEYDIGEGGGNLSGGQKQRLGIVCALYKRPEVLIFDEATNGVSVEVEAQILANIRKEFEDITLIAITHRTENLTSYDNVITLKKGKR